MQVDSTRNRNKNQSWYAGAMRLLGIDYGSKRVGVALTDESGAMAFPHEVVANDDAFIEYIGNLVKEKKVGTIVIGHSLNREGDPNPIHTNVSEFVLKLSEVVTCPIKLEPEHYTTQEAIRTQGRTKDTDASAAALILNSFITRTK